LQIKTYSLKSLKTPKRRYKNINILTRVIVAFFLLTLSSFLAHSQVITVTVKYNSAQAGSKASLADLKYNKQSVLSMEVDDQPANVMSVKAFLQGGVATEDGLTYTGKYFTDGCGNNKPYTLGVAMTAHSNYNDGDLTLVPSLLNTSQLKTLVASGFLLENHGFYHEQDQYYVTNNFTEPRNILENTNFIYDKTGFVSRVWVTPSNYTGYNPYVQQQGFMAATSQSVTDGYTSQPANMWSDHLADLSQLDSNFNVFLRDFNDDWGNSSVTNELKSRVADLRSKSSSTIHKIYRLGTHSYNSNNWQGFKSFFDYVDSVSGNTIWVTSLQELLEYLEVKRKLVMTQSLKRNVLTITLDLSNVPAKNSYRDISLLATNNTSISSISVSGADSYSYNTTTGLINIFKRKTVFNPPYNKPAPNAGADKKVILPVDSVLLSGNLTDTTVHVISYSWAKVSGPDSGTIISPSLLTTFVTGLVQGNYVFRLTAIDENGIHGTDDVAVNVISIVSPGSVFHVEAENWTAMSGVQTEACSDTGGTLDVGWIDNGDWMDYGLTVGTSGSYNLNLRVASPYTGAQLVVKNKTGTIVSTVNIPTTGGFQNWQTVSVPLNLIAGDETLRIESTAGAGWNINWMELVGATATNQAPTANAGADQTITLPANSVSLAGSGTDADGTIVTYAWTKLTGGAATLTSPSSASTTITGLVAGSYTFRLTVTDNSGASTSDDVIVTVNAATNQPPTVNAGQDQTITLPVSSVNLSGTASDADGSIVTYAWTQVGGVAATIVSPSDSTTSITGLSAGTYTFRLTVTDNNGASASDDVNVVVNSTTNQPPTVNAGLDQTITLPVSSVNLSGTASDADGSIVTYAWTRVTGTGGTISSPVTPSTSVTGLSAGSYTFRLTVTDNSGASTSDDVIVLVNQQPTPVFSVRIEAESFTNTTAAVTKTATTDVGGGQQVGSLDNGDVLNYTVDVPYSGTYTANFRVGATKGGSKLLLLNNAGTLLATINVPNTGSAWQTVSVSINLTAGSQQTFKVQVNKTAGNPVFNWWELVNSNSGTVISGTSSKVTNQEFTPFTRLNIYPTPIQNQATVVVNDPYMGLLNIQLWNIAGIIQKQFTWNKNTTQLQSFIYVGDLPNGEYILTLKINKQLLSQKFIKL
jgi:hypothetical protein